jgi:hypothetical protein
MTPARPIIFCIALFFFTQCGKEKTQEEKYNDMTSSLKYNTYKTVSKTFVGPSLKTYNAGKPKDSIIDETSLRLLLGYSWAVTGKAEFAFAEADIVSENTDSVSSIFLAHSLRSIVMYEQGWDSLAAKESNIAFGLDTSASGKENLKTQAMVFHLLMGTLFLKEQKFDNATFHFAGFAQITGITWPYLLCDATGEMHKGNYQTGLQKLKKMSKDPSVPEEMRIILAEEITKIEKENGNVDSKLFWPKAIGRILLDDLGKSGKGQWQELMKYIKSVSEKTGA